ncbi:hypothetical protein JX266_014074 [Neoarthrinium moseri]|nr:hypothetical protein JX266_014074 [Neoarthrinium moseri]
MSSPRSMSTRSSGLMKKMNDLRKLSGARCGLFIEKDGIMRRFLSDVDFMERIHQATVYEHNSFGPDDFDTVKARSSQFTATTPPSDSSLSEASFTPATTPSSSRSISSLDLGSPMVAGNGREMGSPPALPRAMPKASMAAVNGVTKNTTQLRPRKTLRNPRRDWF